MNPARSLAPAVVSGNLSALWVYLVAPFAGAFIGILGCRCVHEKGLLYEIAGTGRMKRLLFVCVENSCRSQIAEAFARIYGGDEIEAYSAGSRPSGEVNARAIESMQELGYDLTKHQSKSLPDIPDVEYDFVATMGCGDECPFVRAKRLEEWQIPDPKNLGPDHFREIRNLIEQRLMTCCGG